MKSPISRKKEQAIALAMGQIQQHNPARSIHGKGVKDLNRKLPEGYSRGFFGLIKNWW